MFMTQPPPHIYQDLDHKAHAVAQQILLDVRDEIFVKLI